MSADAPVTPYLGYLGPLRCVRITGGPTPYSLRVVDDATSRELACRRIEILPIAGGDPGGRVIARLDLVAKLDVTAQLEQPATKFEALQRVATSARHLIDTMADYPDYPPEWGTRLQGLEEALGALALSLAHVELRP